MSDSDSRKLELPQTQPFLAVITGPSGAGKTTLVQRFLAEHPNWRFSISTTTRPPRTGEKDGVDYHFVSEDEFEIRVQKKLFLEHAWVHGHRYGTELTELNKMGNDGLILDVDIQGGETIHNLKPQALLVFIAPPNIDTLHQRITERNTDDESQVRLRLNSSLREMDKMWMYHYLIINDELKEAYSDLVAILRAEPLRLARRKR